MGYIFISYSHQDKNYVHKLRNALQSEGFEVWIDDRIDYGDEWPMVIQERLDECQAFILIASENSYKSRWVQKEVARAQRINKAVFPLLLSGNPWLSIESTQYVDVRDNSLPPERFYGRLAAVAPRIKTESGTANAPAPLPKPAPVARSNGAQFWNAKTKAMMVRVAIVIAVVAIVTASLVGAGRYFGFVDTSDPHIGNSPLISRLRMTTNKEGTYSVTTFSRDQAIYVKFDVGYRSSATYESKWYYLMNFFGSDVNFLVTKIEYAATPSSSTVYFQLNNPGVAGHYRVDIYREDLLIGTAFFSIK